MISLPKRLILLGSLLVMGLCLLATFLLFGSGIAVWFLDSNSAAGAAQPTRRNFTRVDLPPPPTFTVTSTPTPILIATPTSTPTRLLTVTSTPSASPTATPLPVVTNTPSPPPPPPTATAPPPETPTPSPPNYLFVIKETAKFETSHLNFDVYVAITDDDNTPLSGYRVIGTHSSGLQIESSVSAGAWTENSGAMHYKAGNIKYTVPNSPGGVWNLQLVDSDGNAVGPPVELAFDIANPSWYFLYYERQ